MTWYVFGLVFRFQITYLMLMIYTNTVRVCALLLSSNYLKGIVLSYIMASMACVHFIVHLRVIVWGSCYLILWSVRVSIPLRSN